MSDNEAEKKAYRSEFRIAVSLALGMGMLVMACVCAFPLAFQSTVALDETCRADCAVEYGKGWRWRRSPTCDCIGPNGEIRGLAK